MKILGKKIYKFFEFDKIDIFGKYTITVISVYIILLLFFFIFTSLRSKI